MARQRRRNRYHPIRLTHNPLRLWIRLLRLLARPLKEAIRGRARPVFFGLAAAVFIFDFLFNDQHSSMKIYSKKVDARSDSPLRGM
jgi:hypothetical protein